MIEGARERYEGGAKTVSGIKVLGRQTIQVTLTHPDVTFLYALDAALHGAGAQGGGREVR